jgi:hypothetical protein
LESDIAVSLADVGARRRGTFVEALPSDLKTAWDESVPCEFHPQCAISIDKTGTSRLEDKLAVEGYLRTQRIVALRPVGNLARRVSLYRDKNLRCDNQEQHEAAVGAMQ